MNGESAGKSGGLPPVELLIRTELEDGMRGLAYVLVPVFQVFLQLRHESACVGAVDDAVIEAQSETDDAADGDRIGAVLIGNYGGFFKEAAYTQNCRFRLVDDRSAELLAENSW